MPVSVTSIGTPDWAIRVSAPGEVVTDLDDIAQCIGLLLRTPRGADPLRPECGCDAFLYLDRPMSEAVPNIKRGITEAIRLWEPRALVQAVTHAIADDGAGATFTIAWTTADGRNGETTAAYARS